MGLSMRPSISTGGSTLPPPRPSHRIAGSPAASRPPLQQSPASPRREAAKVPHSPPPHLFRRPQCQLSSGSICTCTIYDAHVPSSLLNMKVCQCLYASLAPKLLTISRHAAESRPRSRSWNCNHFSRSRQLRKPWVMHCGRDPPPALFPRGKK